MQIEVIKGKKIDTNKLLLIIVEHSRPFIIGLMIIVLTGVVWFIFQYVYVPLTRAVELAELKESTSIVRPDSKLLDETIKQGELRRTILETEWSRIRNPFTIAIPEVTAEPVEETSENISIDSDQ